MNNEVANLLPTRGQGVAPARERARLGSPEHPRTRWKAFLDLSSTKRNDSEGAGLTVVESACSIARSQGAVRGAAEVSMRSWALERPR